MPPLNEDFRPSIEHIIKTFLTRRQTKFAKSHNCATSDIHAHNNKPISYLVKKFKSENSIKSHLFKSLSPEQQAAWVAFYDANKDLVIMTNGEHEEFHRTHAFNNTTCSWEDPSARKTIRRTATTPKE